MSDMMNKSVLFLAVNGLESESFKKLWQCFGDLNASTRIASFVADEEIISQDGSISTHSDMSFAEATDQVFDVVVIADGITANKTMDDLAANTIIRNAFERNAALVAIDEGVLALVSADVISGQTLSAPESLKDKIESVGGKWSSEEVQASNNLFTALKSANLQKLCAMVADYITSLGSAFAA